MEVKYINAKGNKTKTNVVAICLGDVYIYTQKRFCNITVLLVVVY